MTSFLLRAQKKNRGKSCRFQSSSWRLIEEYSHEIKHICGRHSNVEIINPATVDLMRRHISSPFEKCFTFSNKKSSCFESFCFPGTCQRPHPSVRVQTWFSQKMRNCKTLQYSSCSLSYKTKYITLYETLEVTNRRTFYGRSIR